jgi:outer membrane protein assembly factor BamB
VDGYHQALRRHRDGRAAASGAPSPAWCQCPCWGPVRLLPAPGPAATGPGAGTTVTPLSDVLKTQLELGGNPDWLAGYGAFVWVKRDSGMVSKLDAVSGQQVAEVRADTKSRSFCQGIGAGGGAVWSCSGSDVVRIDPDTATVTASVPVGKIFEQGRLVHAGGHVWVITGKHGDKLVGIDSASLERTMTVSLGRPCTDLGSGGAVVWVVCRDANRILRFDPRSRRVTGSVPIAGPTVALSSKRALWVGTATCVVRFDARSLRPIATFPDLAPGDVGDLTIARDGVWVRTTASFLSRIDPASNRVVEQIRPPQPLPGGSALAFAGALWADAGDANQLFQLARG